MNNTMDKENDSQKEGKIKGGTVKLKLKLKFKGGLPKPGVDLLGIAQKLSAKKFAHKE